MFFAIPLLSLPFVALREVYKELRPMELFQLALTSSKAKQNLSMAIPKHTYHLCFTLSEKLEVKLKDGFSIDDDFHLIASEDADFDVPKGYCCKMGEENIRFSTTSIMRDKVWCYWKPSTSQKKGFTTFIKFFLETFNYPLVTLKFEKGACPQFAVELMAFMDFQNVKVKKASYSLINPPEEAYTEFLKECREVPKLKLLNSPAKYSPPHSFPMLEIEKLEIVASAWLRLEDFMNCEQVKIDKKYRQKTSGFPYLKPQNLNNFLRKWIRTDCRLSLLELKFDGNFEVVVQGLNPASRSDYGKCLGIEGPNGKIFLISHSNGWLVMKMEDELSGEKPPV